MTVEKSNTQVDDDLGLELDFGPEDVEKDQLDFSQEEEDILTKTSDNSKGDNDSDENLKEGKSSNEITNDLDINAAFEKLKDEDKDLEDPETVDDKSKTVNDDFQKSSKADKNTSDSLTVAFGKILQEQGFSDFNEEQYLKDVKEKGEAAAFMDMLEQNAESKAISAKNSLDDYTKEYIKFRESGFSKKEAQTLTGNRENIDSITNEHLEKDIKLQEQVVKEVGKIRGLSEDEIDEQIELLKDTDKLENRSTANLKTLQKYYSDIADREYKIRQDNIKAQNDKDNNYLSSLKEKITNTNEYIKGKKINAQTKDKIYDAITKPIKLENGSVTNKIWAKRNEDTMDFDSKLAYMIESGLFDGDVQDLKSKVKTEAVNKLKRTLNSGANISSGDPNIESRIRENNIDAMKEFLED